MPTTLKAIVRQMLLLEPALGRTETVAGLAAKTVTVTALAAGGSDQRFVNQWILRADAANTADRRRICTSFAPATGVLTHAGTDYVDTTVGTEQVSIVRFEPRYFDNSVQEGLRKTLRRHTIHIPLRTSARHYYLGEFDWLRDPNDVLEVRYSSSPILVRNDDFQFFNTVNSSGVLQPDDWTLAGANATMARSTTQVDPALAMGTGAWSLAITRAGTDCTLTQSPGLLQTGVASDSLQSQAVAALARVWSAVASQVRLRATDDGGATYTSSDYHTGSSTWEELTLTKTLSSAATNLQVLISVEGSNTVCYVSRCRLAVLSAVDDTLRRGNYGESLIPRESYRYEQATGTFSLIGEHLGGRGGSLEIDTKRPYPQFDSARLTGDSADGDTSDAPVDLIATGALAELYRYQATNDENSKEEQATYAGRELYWTGKFKVAQDKHLYMPSRGPQGLPPPPAIPRRLMTV